MVTFGLFYCILFILFIVSIYYIISKLSFTDKLIKILYPEVEE